MFFFGIVIDRFDRFQQFKKYFWDRDYGLRVSMCLGYEVLCRFLLLFPSGEGEYDVQWIWIIWTEISFSGWT